METVTVPKTEYRKLKRQATAYRKIAGSFLRMVVRDPVEEVVEDFRSTDLYTVGFLKDLETGLRKSSYGKV